MTHAGIRRFAALIWKESIQIVRDPSSILIAFVLPLILLFLFGYGVSLDANHLKIGLVIEDSSEPAQSLAASFRSSRYFDVHVSTDRRVFAEDLVAGRLFGIVVIPSTFGRQTAKGLLNGQIQILTDGSQPNTARFVENYARALWSNWVLQRAARGERVRQSLTLEPRFWFNPELQSRYFLVPGSIVIVMALIGTLLTAMVVAREWERGAMEAMMATPVSVAELILGKLIPYFFLALCSMALCAVLGVWLFGVPFRGSIFALTLITSAFLVPALGQGLLISSVAKNQFVASQIALLSGFLPAFLLSGFVFEISSMPAPIQIISHAIPARYLVPSLQTVFLAGDVWPLFLQNIAALLLIGGVFLVLTIRASRKRLD
jgi:ABC-2 type transport system permease protein